MRVNDFRTPPSGIYANSYMPCLIARPRNAPVQWIGSLEDWCRNAPKQEQSKRLEAAKRVLQQYEDPKQRTLDLSRLELTALPPGLWHLPNLQELNVSKNLGLRELPPDLGKCAVLRSIDASSCSIHEWPACLSELHSLKTLLLDDNPNLRVFPDQIRQCRALEHLSIEATMPRDYLNDPPIRSLPPSDNRGRALVRSASLSPKRSDGNFRSRSISPPPAHATAPSVSTLFGFNRAHKLDREFGSLRWPYRKDRPNGIKPWELDEAGKPLTSSDRIFVPDEKGHFSNLPALLDLEKLKTGEKKYLWAISKSGRLIIAEEKEAIGIKKEDGKQEYIGHPTLVGGGRSRIAGMLMFKADPDNSSSGKFYIDNVSGRYSRLLDRNQMQVEGVAELFRKGGLDVEILRKEWGRTLPFDGLQVSDQDGEALLLPQKQNSKEAPSPTSITAPAT